ncbi:N-acetylmuramic acid 6-phosphate etherase [Photobacterium damselae subsp. piscicida]|uniref:N-acetylmuramic acid 6-phosphate etherase n=1 Tax=Photobacterium damsela subsp. piscicida TaxID=38294 RepID=A0A1Q9GWP5_PHODP|nr:N-acetylmuramic acid 6-phosphate etherase [Photobacterium damselae]MBE8127274.1 N-acetylmuramic acid 6-phosphate etherase [Photobacterium damselae subsp. piscicida]MDP2543735.1 N-acetylmuramic acid 6-phosphate etherase [Photobacterium damselae subsp. piscicida]MDP2567359.1 N-acetylmuramic acid 6-phosphate etherase [Photobacterium damselae subsp. piscicida]OLQ79560.1 N-acetylmuramic acid 6-phosphate etherase [Photobacterium damselae subsp. piscicida]PSV62110.1 N-acetylmuramic acid 6-phosphat
MKIDLSQLVTESRNQASNAIDTLSTLDMVTVINQEDQKVALAVEKTLPEIALAVDAITDAFMAGGRLIYMGAGTSGRLGILDASECPPTYGSNPNQVVGLIAGGHKAILKAVENAEDNRELAKQDLQNLGLTKNDVVVGIAASGRTPYVIGGMKYAYSVGAQVVAVSCNPQSEMTKIADIAITPVVGAEVITGSSRMKAGTAQKLVLNMLTTGAMIRTGKVFGNLMVDVEATNAKLIQRQTNIVMQATDCDAAQAEEALSACDRHCKTAILMILAGLDAEQAKKQLANHNGFIRSALG